MVKINVVSILTWNSMFTYKSSQKCIIDGVLSLIGIRRSER